MLYKFSISNIVTAAIINFRRFVSRTFDRDTRDTQISEKKVKSKERVKPKCVYVITHARDVVVRAHALLQQAISDLPREDRRALALVERDLVDDLRGGHARFAAADGPWPYRSGLIVPATIIICHTLR